MGCISDRQKPNENQMGQSRMRTSTLNTYGQPKSTKIFTGDDMQGQPLQNPDRFMPVQTVQVTDKMTYNRPVDYGQ